MMTLPMTDLADLHRVAIAVVRAHAVGDGSTIVTLLQPLPTEQWPELLGTLATLTIAARPDDLEAFLDHQLGAVNLAESIAGRVGQRQRDEDAEPDGEG